MSPEKKKVDIKRVAESLSPTSPSPLGGGLVLNSVTASGDYGLVFDCTLLGSPSSPSPLPLPELLRSLKSSLDSSESSRQLAAMGISLTYRVTDASGVVAGEAVLSPP